MYPVQQKLTKQINAECIIITTLLHTLCSTIFLCLSNLFHYAQNIDACYFELRKYSTNISDTNHGISPFKTIFAAST